MASASIGCRFGLLLNLLELRCLKVDCFTLMAAFLAALLLVGCGRADGSKVLLGHWRVSKIVYEDGSERELGGSNAVIIEQDHVTELIDGHSKRRYPYQRDGNILKLEAGGEQVKWTVLSLHDDSLEIATPIGTYMLLR